MNTTRVLALLPLFIVLAHSFSWDIVVGRENRLEFFYNGTVTHTEDFPSDYVILSITYDPVHFRVLLFIDSDRPNMFICSFDLTTRKIKTLITRPYCSFKLLAYDPVTQLLFWTEDKNIFSLSLKYASCNEAVDGDLLVTLDNYCGDIAVDSCGGFIYWTTDHEIGRAAFDGSKREVIIDSHVNQRWSLAIDQRAEKMYWIDKNFRFTIESADLNGKNRRTFYIIGKEEWANSLTVSKDFIYWKSHDQAAIMQLPKHQQHGVAPVVYLQSSIYCYWCQYVAANYTMEEQTMGNKSCEARKSHATICHNYCFQGNCTVSAEGHPKCSCEAGYSGVRCEVNACYMYCLNDGVCSMNEAEKPVCQCTADYEGERCDVPICKDYCVQGKCSVSTEGQRTCSCNSGYSGERCDVSICRDYCLQGNCSISTEGQPTCSCNPGYSGERCEVSICQDYCLEGNCSISTQGQRTCRCDAGYSGERCEVNVCHSYCLNNGDCSLNEEDEPVCQCTADYEGERCDVVTIRTDVYVGADKTTQQMLLDLRSEVKQVREDLHSTFQMYTERFDENEAKIQICEESKNDNQQNYDETMSKPQPSSLKL